MASVEKLPPSPDMLRELHAVVIALALVQAISSLLAKTQSGEVVFHAEQLPWFIAFFATLLPFYQGALQYFGMIHKSQQPQRRRKIALFVDYLILFVEACVLVMLSLLIGKPK